MCEMLDVVTQWGSLGVGVLELLGETKVRVLRIEQIARTWFSHTDDPRRNASVWARRLAREGLANYRTAMLHAEIDVSTPLFEYRPGDDEPLCGRLAWRAQSRFRKAAPVRTAIVTAGPRLIARPRPIRATEILHDTLVSQVLLSLCSKDPSVFDRWTHEDMRLGKQGSAIPDAVLSDNDSLTYIECVGSYSAKKIQSIHEAFQHVAYRLY